MPLWSKTLKPKWLSQADKDKTIATKRGWTYIHPNGIKETLACISGLTLSTVPAAFTAGQWTATNAANGGRVNIVISALPSTGNATVTAIQYKVGTGAWVNSGITGTGNFSITGLTNGAAVNITIRLVNVVGAGPDSDVKSVTPTAS